MLAYLPFMQPWSPFASLEDLSSGVPQLATVTLHHFSFSPATFAFQTQLAVAKPSIATSQPADIEKIQQKQQQGAGETYSHLLSCIKRKRLRTMFTKKQLEGLELKFAENKYLSIPDRMELAARLELSKTQEKPGFNIAGRGARSSKYQIPRKKIRNLSPRALMHFLLLARGRDLQTAVRASPQAAAVQSPNSRISVLTRPALMVSRTLSISLQYNLSVSHKQKVFYFLCCLPYYFFLFLLLLLFI